VKSSLVGAAPLSFFGAGLAGRGLPFETDSVCRSPILQIGNLFVEKIFFVC
jgi:hypothetical protein